MMQKKHRAFSLFEMSIVLIIVSLIATGITLATKLVGKSTLAKSQILTKNSPVKDIENLLFWFETSLEESFILSEIDNAHQITSWKNLAPNQYFQSHATQNNSANKPKFYTKIINNSLPVLRFDGIDDYLNLDSQTIRKLLNSPYTIFVVEQRTSNKSSNYFIAGSDTTSSDNLILGYLDNNTINQDHLNSTFYYEIENYDEPIVRIHCFNYSLSLGKKYYLNGALSPNKSDSSPSLPVASFNGASIGKKDSSYYYEGDIAEIIIFNRSLKSEERNLVAQYLAKKYDIK